MGLIAHIYRGTLGDCTNDGHSKHVDRITITNVDGPFEPTDEYPAARLEMGPGGNPVIRFEADAERGRGMFGGNYAKCHDSRMTAAVDTLVGHKMFGSPIAIHDRFEW